MSEAITLDIDGPHSSDYTRQVVRGFAECVRVLNHATRDRGLEYPGDVYDVVAEVKSGAYGLRQLFGQLGEFLQAVLAAGLLRADTGEPSAAVAVASTVAALNGATRAAGQLYERLDEAHNALAALGALDAAHPAEEN